MTDQMYCLVSFDLGLSMLSFHMNDSCCGRILLIQSPFRRFHELHQTAGHEIRTTHAVVVLVVFAKA